MILMYRRYRLCRSIDCDLSSKNFWTKIVELSKRNISCRFDSTAKALRSFEIDKKSTEDVKMTKLFYLRQRFSEWRVRIAVICELMFLISLINILLLTWSTRMYNTQDRIETISVKSCQTTKGLNTWLHLVINVLRTAMLDESNYCTTNNLFMSEIAKLMMRQTCNICVLRSELR
jgi:hypothetical protein